MNRHAAQLTKIALIPVIVVLLASCAAAGGSGASRDRPGASPPAAYVEGIVTAGPRCPVARAERPCPPAPVPGARVELLDGARVVADGLTDQRGRFRLGALAGDLTVRATNVGAYRSTATHAVRLVSGTTTTVTLQLDTGIR